MVEISAAEGIVSTAPRRRRFMLPSNACGLARKIANMVFLRSESERAPTRQATPRSVALAPIFTWVVVRVAFAAGDAVASEVAIGLAGTARVLVTTAEAGAARAGDTDGAIGE